MLSQGQETAVLRAPSGPIWTRSVIGLGRFTKRRPLGATGLYILVFAVVVAAIGPLIAPHDPWEPNRTAPLVAPNATFWLGTDALGRDILSRVIYGARVSMYVSVVTTLAATSIGAVVGVSSAYFGGKFDLIIQRFVDAQSAFPSLLLALAIMAAFGASLNNVILALTVIFSSRGVRVIRSQSLSVKELPYVESARAIGSSPLRIMLRHIFPNTFGPMMVVGTTMLGSAILLESSLSFLGAGIPATVISWGGMLSGDVLRNLPGAPWIGIAPGLALTSVVFGINVYGDTLRDILDPRLRGR